MKQRLLALMTALALILAGAPAVAAGEFTVRDGRLESYNGAGGAVTVPTGVTVIGASAFENNSKVTSVTLPEGVTAIEERAFRNCSALKRVNLPAGLTSIGAYAFGDCRSLGAVTVPEGVTSLGREAFSWCLNLEQVALPVTLRSIGDNAFLHCSVLTGVTIPDTTAELGAGIFEGCPEVVLHATPGSAAEAYAVDYYLTHVSDGMPTAPGGAVAFAAAQEVDVDGTLVRFEMYALKDIKGNATNYVKLRDVAVVLSGTAAQFNVTWNGDINVETGRPYVKAGGEMTTPFRGDRSYTRPSGVTAVDGIAAMMDAIQLTDDAGRGYTYYKLRDLGAAVGFNVYWDQKNARVCVRTAQPYTGVEL